jgi:hypothetical protein
MLDPRRHDPVFDLGTGAGRHRVRSRGSILETGVALGFEAGDPPVRALA